MKFEENAFFDNSDETLQKNKNYTYVCLKNFF